MTLLAVNDAARAVTDRLDDGFLRIYDGEDILVQVRFSDPAFGPVADGRTTAYPLEVGRARRGGTARSWAALDRDGTPIIAGVVGGDMLLSQKGIDAGAEIRVRQFTYRQEP